MIIIAKKKSIDYILGMITRTSLMIAAWRAGNTIKEAKVVNQYIWIL
jgi:hypothetical protein